MHNEPFDLEQELEELEKELGMKIEDMDPAPVRANFQEDLRRSLQETMEKKALREPVKKGFSLKGFIPSIKPDEATDKIKSLLPSFKLPSFKLPFMGRGRGGLRNWKTVTSFALVIVMMVTIFWGVGELGLFLNPVKAGEITIKALSQDKMGIDPDTVFVLNSSEPLDEKTVKEFLKVSPSFGYNLEKKAGGKEFRIIPQEKLSPNTIYRLSFDLSGAGRESLSWAFQTKGKFRVIRSLPGDKSSHVPVQTGIELTFSHENFDAGKVKDFFTISPQVEGKFEKHKKTIAFVPKELKPMTIYTVTLKKGMTLPETKDVLEEDYVFTFETGPEGQDNQAFSFDLDTRLTEFGTNDAPVFPVYFFRAHDIKNPDTSSIPPLHVNLYRFPDYKEFKGSLAKRDQLPQWSYFALNRYKADLNPQYKVQEFDTTFLSAGNYNHYIVFPQRLEAGYYAAEFKAQDALRQVWFQVTDLAVYLAQGENSSLVWANDLGTKAPAQDVQVVLDSKNITVKGDAAGVALIKESLLGAAKDYALVKSGTKETLVPLEAWPEWYEKKQAAARDYWKYLYLDRELYQPGDTVNFWGVLAPRDKGESQAKEITIELQGTDGPYYEGAESRPILTQKIAVKDKTYTGQMKLPTVKPGYYYLQVKIGETNLLSRGFSVETYQKPSYKLEVTQDKRAIFAGEGLNFQAKASFFEGTPVPGLKLNYYIQGKEGSVTTGEKGEARIPYVGAVHDDYYGTYNYVTMGVTAALPEAGEIHTSTEMYVFRSKVYLTGEAKRDGENLILNGKVSMVDLSKVNAGEFFTEDNFLAGPAPNTLIKAGIFQEVWTKVESGEQYDFINKKVEKIYHYDYSTKHVQDLSVISGPDGTFTINSMLDPQNSYYLELTAEDHEGRQFKRRVHVGIHGSYYPGNFYYYLRGQQGNQGYKAGDDVQISFMENDREITPKGKSLLFYRGQKTIDAYAVSDNSRYGFTFTQDHIPNVNVYGVYFDGYNYYEASSWTVPFARETKALKVQVVTDQAEYRPGGKVKLSVQVTDAENKPVKGARVNLNLVDEALFSLRDQEVNLLNSLYGDHLYMFLMTHKTHYHPQFGGGAEKGGEGDSDRKDFRDTVLFTTLETDGSGRAGTEFQLPDNLTTWRVTYHALTDDLRAGSGTHPLPVRLPFFVEMTLNNLYLEGDSPVVILRSFGEKLAAAQAVAYQAKLVSPRGQEKVLTLNGVSFTPVDWALSSLEAGKYTLTVSGSGSGYQDTLTRDFTVVKSLLERTVTDHNILQEGLEVKGSQQEPTTLVFSDYEKSQYIEGLYRLSWQYGGRLEQKLASREARKLLTQYFPEEKAYFAYFSDDDQEPLVQYQRPDGGISILPYGESELALSALAASSAPGYFDTKALAGYFYRILEGREGEDDRSLALMGLAALKEPVLLQINDYLKEKNLKPAVKINLATALLDIGDGAVARQVFRDLMSQYSQDMGASIRIKAGQDQDEQIEATTQMALLAARLDQPEKNKLYQYLLENPGQDILNTVEQLQILKYSLRYMNPSPVGFTYELKGEQVTKTLNGQETLWLTVLPEDLKTLKFIQIQGKVGVMSKYTVPYQAGQPGESNDLKIERSYLVNKTTAGVLKRSDLVQVVLTYNVGDKAPGGIYEIVDVLPAGLSYISRTYLRGEKPNWDWWSYPTEVNGQKLTFNAAKGSRKITYYARVISPGEFTGEPSVLSNIKNSQIYTSGSKDRVVIK